jgi:RNA polymerase sigma-70 factor (ECF subfamily)
MSHNPAALQQSSGSIDAETLVALYTDRLIALARSRLPRKLAGRVDPEDVVQSAFRSFFRIARDPDRKACYGDDLWQILASITVNKVRQKIDHHTAKKRAVDRESVAFGAEFIDVDEWGTPRSREPSPEEASILIEELQLAMRGLIPLHLRVVEMILQGHPSELVAAEVGRSDRMVRIILERFRERLERRLSDNGGD